MRISTRHGLAITALALALPAGLTSSALAAPAPPCDTATYPVPFLRLFGGIFSGKTRFIELQVRPGADTAENAWSDPEYPFPVTVTPSNGAPRSFNVTNYARDQFPAKFTSKTQTTHVTATYTEIHTSWSPPGVPVTTRCSRTISATYKTPPTPRPTKRRTGGGGRNTGGQSEDRDDDDR